MRVGVVVAVVVPVAILTTYLLVRVIYRKPIIGKVMAVAGEHPLSSREALFSDDLRNVNINAAVASVIGKYLLMDYVKDLRLFDDYDPSQVIVGETDFWRRGVDFLLKRDFRSENCNETSGRPKPRRRLYVIRHTEKLSKVIPNWGKLAFGGNGSYQRVDLNMPVVLPRRNLQPSNVENDPPISMTGHIQAWLIGHCLSQMGVTVSHVYSSPTLRCVESANTMLLGMGVDVAIKVEPVLLEWFKWSRDSRMMSAVELRRYRLNVDVDYKPFMPYDKLNYSEAQLDEYIRCDRFVRQITERHRDEGGNILIVGHLSTMETVTRMLSGGQPLPYREFLSRVYEKPFGLISVLEEGCHDNDSWRKVLPPTLPITWHGRLLNDLKKVLEIMMT